MRRIRPCSLFVHMINGCGDTSKDVPDFWGEKFRQLFSPPLSPLSTTIRVTWRVGFRPIWCAESHCSLQCPIIPLVVVQQAKTCKFRNFKIPPKLSSPPCASSLNYNQRGYAGCFQTYLIRWIRQRPPFVHSTCGSWATSKSVPNSAGKNSAQSFFTTLYSITNLQSEQRGGLV